MSPKLSQTVPNSLPNSSKHAPKLSQTIQNSPKQAPKLYQTVPNRHPNLPKHSQTAPICSKLHQTVPNSPEQSQTVPNMHPNSPKHAPTLAQTVPSSLKQTAQTRRLQWLRRHLSVGHVLMTRRQPAFFLVLAQCWNTAWIALGRVRIEARWLAS